MAVCKNKDCNETTNHPGGYCISCYIKVKEAKNGINTKKSDSFEYKPSEGELFIEDFFKNYEIKYKSQIKIENLKGDTASYRVADFYLPKYKVYIEFLGQWNTSENKERYKLKKDLYFKNKIPCVYLYPENLGILPFVFDRRIQKVLSDFGYRKQLRMYRLFKFDSGEGFRMVLITISIIVLLIIREQIVETFPLYIIGAIVIISQFYYLIKTFRKIFIKNNYSLSKLD